MWQKESALNIFKLQKTNYNSGNNIIHVFSIKTFL